MTNPYEPPNASVRSVYNSNRRVVRQEEHRLLLQLREKDQQLNAQGHPLDCVCRTCFEAWRATR